MRHLRVIVEVSTAALAPVLAAAAPCAPCPRKMGEITKATQDIRTPVTVPQEGPVISRDEVVTTTASSMTVTTVTKTRAEVNDEATGKQITRDTTTTIEKTERNTPTGVILMETKTSESWVKAEEGTLHFIESESSTTHSRPGSAHRDKEQPVDGKPADLPSDKSQPDSVPTGRESSRAVDTQRADSSLRASEHEQLPPHCEPKQKDRSPTSHISVLEPPPQNI